MATVSKSFTAVGVSAELLVRSGEQFTYAVSGTFVGTVVVESSNNGGLAYTPLVSATGSASGTVIVEDSARQNVRVRVRCSDYTSGTIVTALADVADDAGAIDAIRDAQGMVVFKAVDGGVKAPGTLEVTGASTFTGVATMASPVLNDPVVNRTAQKRIHSAGAYAGQSAGWLLGTLQLTNIGTAALLPASVTAGILIFPISGLKVGDTITAFHLIGQIESAGGAVTLDADLRKITAVAADNTDASIGGIVQLAVSADTKISSTNSSKTLATPEVVAADETFYVLITGTTAALTDIALNGVAVTVTEA